MNRRHFLSGLASLVAAPLVVQGAAPYQLTYRGWTLAWRDFMTVDPQQDVEVGFWTARTRSRPGKFIASTSNGHVDEYQELQAIDFDCTMTWPYVTSQSTLVERETSKRLAYGALLAALHDA